MEQQSIVILGAAVVFIGMLIIAIGSVLGGKSGDSSRSGSGFAVGGFIGPIPFGWATDKPLLYAVIAVSVILFLCTLFVRWKGF